MKNRSSVFRRAESLLFLTSAVATAWRRKGADHCVALGSQRFASTSADEGSSAATLPPLPAAEAFPLRHSASAADAKLSARLSSRGGAAVSPSPVIGRREQKFLTAKAVGEVYRMADVTPKKLSDLHHRSRIGGRLAKERAAVAEHYGHESHLVKLRSESAAIDAIRTADTIDDVVSMMVFKSTLPTTQMLVEAASSALKLSIENRIPNASLVSVMSHLAKETGTDADSRWAVTPEEALAYQRYLAVKQTLVRSVGLQEDDAAVRRLMAFIIKRDVPPTAGMLCDLALMDISFATGMTILDAFIRLMSAGGGADAEALSQIAPPTELMARLMGLATLADYEDALALYNHYLASGFEALPAGAHGHALTATRWWLIDVKRRAAGSPPKGVMRAITSQVQRIRDQIDVDKLKGEEGVYVLSTLVALQAECGLWEEAEQHLKRFTVISAKANASAVLDLAEEEEALLTGGGEGGEEGAASPYSRKSNKAEQRANALKLAKETKLLVHTPTSLVLLMTAALRQTASAAGGKTSTHPAIFTYLKSQFNDSGFKFSECEHYTLADFLRALQANRFENIGFGWIEERLIGDLVSVEEKPADSTGAEEEGENKSVQTNERFHRIFYTSERPVTAHCARVTFELLLQCLGAFALDNASVRAKTVEKPSDLFWLRCVDVYRAVLLLPIAPYRSGIVTRARTMSGMLQTLLNCMRVFGAPREALEALGAHISTEYSTDSAEFALFCAAVLKSNAALTHVGSMHALKAYSIEFIRSHHHCLRLLTHTAAKAPNGFESLHMARCRRGAACFLRAGVAKGLVAWDTALDLLLCHPLVASQDPTPDPAIFLDLAIVMSYCPHKRITMEGRPVPLDAITETTRAGESSSSSSFLVSDFVLFALSMAPRTLVDVFMGVVADGHSRGGFMPLMDTAESVAQSKFAVAADSPSGNSYTAANARGGVDVDADGDAAANQPAAYSNPVESPNGHLLSFIASAVGVPMEDAWSIFDNQRHRLRGHAMPFFERWAWRVDAAETDTQATAAVADDAAAVAEGASESSPSIAPQSPSPSPSRTSRHRYRPLIRNIFKDETADYFNFTAITEHEYLANKESSLLKHGSGNSVSGSGNTRRPQPGRRRQRKQLYELRPLSGKALLTNAERQLRASQRRINRLAAEGKVPDKFKLDTRADAQTEVKTVLRRMASAFIEEHNVDEVLSSDIVTMGAPRAKPAAASSNKGSGSGDAAEGIDVDDDADDDSVSADDDLEEALLNNNVVESSGGVLVDEDGVAVRLSDRIAHQILEDQEERRLDMAAAMSGNGSQNIPPAVPDWSDVLTP